MIKRITEREEIERVMGSFLRGERPSGVEFIAALKTKNPNWIHEGTRPIGKVTSGEGEVVYSLANGDSGYTRAYVQVRLEEIEYVELLEGSE